MGRISRTDVEWEADGKTWLAKFKHQHAEKGAVMGREPIPVKHLTICELSWKRPSGVTVVGESRCSVKDTYQWRFGLKQSLIRALHNAGISQEHDKARYGLILKKFFEALRIKDYWPHNASLPVRAVRSRTMPVVDGFVIAPTEYVGKQHGMGWSGD